MSTGIDSWGYYVFGLPVGSPNGIEVRTFLKKFQRMGLTFEFKHQFHKCKMVSSSPEKYPEVLEKTI